MICCREVRVQGLEATGQERMNWYIYGSVQFAFPSFRSYDSAQGNISQRHFLGQPRKLLTWLFFFFFFVECIKLSNLTVSYLSWNLSQVFSNSFSLMTRKWFCLSAYGKSDVLYVLYLRPWWTAALCWSWRHVLLPSQLSIFLMTLFPSKILDLCISPTFLA